MRTRAAFVLLSLTGLVLPAQDPKQSLGALIDGSGFVQVRAGEFRMGSSDGNADEQPPHPVRITEAFQIGKFEVTQAQWEAVMRDPHAAKANLKESTNSTNPSHFKGASRPVENVSWETVQQFIQALNKRDEKHIYRLPTEAEWEYVAQVGEAETEHREPDLVAWYESNSEGQTHPVGQKAPNRAGVYDMLGNVAEWVQDWYGMDSYPAGSATDPKGPATGSYRVYRGAAWLSAAKYLRPAFRAFDFPTSGYYNVGFRLVRTPR